MFILEALNFIYNKVSVFHIQTYMPIYHLWKDSRTSNNTPKRKKIFKKQVSGEHIWVKNSLFTENSV